MNNSFIPFHSDLSKENKSSHLKYFKFYSFFRTLSFLDILDIFITTGTMRCVAVFIQVNIKIQYNSV